MFPDHSNNMPGKREGAASPEVHRAAHWLNSYSKASKWMGRYNLHQMLDENGGLIRIENFLPPFVAGGHALGPCSVS